MADSMNWYGIMHSDGGEVFFVDREWLKEVYAPSSCPGCRIVLDTTSDAMNVRVTKRVRGLQGCFSYYCGLKFVRDDYYEILKDLIGDFPSGKVIFSGRPLTGYRTLFVPLKYRIPIYGREWTKTFQCRSCDRWISSPSVDGHWTKPVHIGSLKLFTGPGGLIFYANDEVISRFPKSISRHFVYNPLEVRDE
jgi:hypothetical protein